MNERTRPSLLTWLATAVLVGLVAVATGSWMPVVASVALLALATLFGRKGAE